MPPDAELRLRVQPGTASPYVVRIAVRLDTKLDRLLRAPDPVLLECEPGTTSPSRTGALMAEVALRARVPVDLGFVDLASALQAHRRLEAAR